MPLTNVIESEYELRTVFPPPAGGAVAKQIDELDDHCRAFLAHSPFLVLGTTNPEGTGDTSPKGGPAGFVKVLDANTVAFGELPGNYRIDGFRNIVRDRRVGLIFFIPGLDESLRINGTAVIVRDPDVLAACSIDDKLPKVAVVVTTNEIFIHCGKAMRRSSLWKRDGWPDVSDMATVACMLVAHVKVPGDPDGTKTGRMLEKGYAATMWNE